MNGHARYTMTQACGPGRHDTLRTLRTLGLEGRAALDSDSEERSARPWTRNAVTIPRPSRERSERSTLDSESRRACQPDGGSLTRSGSDQEAGWWPPYTTRVGNLLNDFRRPPARNLASAISDSEGTRAETRGGPLPSHC
jgi:hypothetical protein